MSRPRAEPPAEPESGALGRRLMRACDRAALATSLAGAPYASLVLVACDLDASPLLLLSDLARHSRNIAAEPRVSLLFDGTAGLADPLTGPRLTLLGQAQRSTDPRLLARFIERHPSSRVYAGFADFRLYRITIERGHLVAGFGRIEWLDAEVLRFAGDAGALAAAEPDILRHMNDEHAEAIALVANRLLGRGGRGWRMTGIDPEGIDLRREGEAARADFSVPVTHAAAARTALIDLAERARGVPKDG